MVKFAQGSMVKEWLFSDAHVRRSCVQMLKSQGDNFVKLVHSAMKTAVGNKRWLVPNSRLAVGAFV